MPLTKSPRPHLGSALPLASLVALLVAGCGGQMSSQSQAVTYHKDVAPILQEHCQGCHSPGRLAHFSLTSYAQAKGAAALMVREVKAGRMPPWNARSTPECQPRFGWQDDTRLPAAATATLERWLAAGTPEGDPKEAPALRAPPPDDLPGMTMELQPQQPFKSSGERDQFICFVMDPKLTQPGYFNGWHFVAGNKEVVHHALMFTNPDGAARKKANAEGWFDCFANPGVEAQLIGAWAPGSVPAVLPPNIATTLKPGSLLVMQIHYHPAGRDLAADSTKFQMRFIKASPEWQLTTSLVGNAGKYDAKTGDGLQPDAKGVAEFRIPAGESAKEIKQVFTIPDKINGTPTPDLRIYSVGTHMHYVGRDMKIEIDRAAPRGGDPKNECLIQTPEWDFNWQRWYVYDTSIDQLPRAGAGDKLKMRCTYDNSLGNPKLVAALAEEKLAQPREVRLGESTLDEMCLGVFGAIYRP